MFNSMENNFGSQKKPEQEKDTLENQKRFDENLAYQKYESDILGQIAELKNNLSPENLALLNEYEDLEKSYNLKQEVLETAADAAYDYNLDKLAKIKPHLDELEEKIKSTNELQNFFVLRNNLEKTKIDQEQLLPNEKSELLQKYQDSKEQQIMNMIDNLEESDKEIYHLIKRIHNDLETDSTQLENFELRDILSRTLTESDLRLEIPFSELESKQMNSLQEKISLLKTEMSRLKDEAQKSPDLKNVFQSQNIEL